MGATTYNVNELPRIGDKIINSKVSIYKWGDDSFHPTDDDKYYDISYWIEIDKYGWVELPLEIHKLESDIDTCEISIEEFEKIIKND